MESNHILNGGMDRAACPSMDASLENNIGNCLCVWLVMYCQYMTIIVPYILVSSLLLVLNIHFTNTTQQDKSECLCSCDVGPWDYNAGAAGDLPLERMALHINYACN